MWDDFVVIDATTADELGLTAVPAPLHRRFALGAIYCTPNALDLLISLDVASANLLERHAAGDWGDIDAEDRGLNDHALQIGARVFSVYAVGAEARAWIITEADRASTTILLPSEY